MAYVEAIEYLFNGMSKQLSISPNRVFVDSVYLQKIMQNVDSV